MKGPNGKSVILNRATVSISSTVYDRRALDCTDDKALVNSLNHLTFLTSSSIKVREAMINDGAIERLVDILHECRDPKNQTDNVMFAWKWVLSLQCLVLAGTRGSEKMRKKLVHAGIIPVLATILDNHFLTRKSLTSSVNQRQNYVQTTGNTDTNNNSNSHSNNNRATDNINNNDNNNNDNNDNTTVSANNIDIDNNNPTEQSSNEPVESSSSSSNSALNTNTSTFNEANDDVFINSNDDDDNTGISNVFRNVRNVVEQADQTILDTQNEVEKYLNRNDSNFTNNNSNSNISTLCEEELELLTVVELVKCFQKLGDSNIGDNIKNLMNTNFKEILSDPILACEFTQRLEISNILTPNNDPFNNKINSMPLHHTVPRTFENGLILPATDDVIWSLQLLAFISKYTYLRQFLANTYLINGLSFRSRNHPPPLETDSTSIDLDEMIVDSNEDLDFASPLFLQDNLPVLMDFFNANESFVKLKQNERLNRLSTLSDDSDHGIVQDYFKILESNNKLEKIKYLERIRLNSTRIKHESLGKLRSKSKFIYKKKLEDYSEKWDYDNSWDEFEKPTLIDKDNLPFATLNIFPLVERYSVKTWFQEDICYWAAVVVRNANRKDEKMGGRRQCANFNCGKWEDHPKQFSKCRRCKRAKYCSRDCQTKAWVFHKHWCVPAVNTTNNILQGRSNEIENQQNNNHHQHERQHEQHQHEQQHQHEHEDQYQHNQTITQTGPLADSNIVNETNDTILNDNERSNLNTANTTNTSISSIGPRTISSNAVSGTYSAAYSGNDDNNSSNNVSRNQNNDGR